MKGIQWFEVDLETLRLREINLTGWPDSMPSRNRMQEECLESVIAFNLDVLFPDEDLLLICTQFMAQDSGDILALDPCGYLRLLELKKEPTSLAALENQVVSYGIDRDRLPTWEELMARGIPGLPERVEVRLEGFKANVRTQVTGRPFVLRHTPDALDEAWHQKHAIEKDHLRVNALRVYRGVIPGPPVLENPIISDVIARVYGLGLEEIPLDDPDRAVTQILNRYWGCQPFTFGTEFTLIAPNLSRRIEAGISLEERGAHFHLIDAELRHTSKRVGVERAVLRWQPLHRTSQTDHIQTAMSLRRLLHIDNPEVASFQCRSSYRQFYWRHFDHVYLWVEPTGHGDWIIRTRFDQLTNGLADLKPKWRAGMRELRQKLPEQNHEIHQSSQDKLYAPWDIDNLQPAATLFTAYYDMLKREGFFDLDRYRWYRRPKVICDSTSVPKRLPSSIPWMRKR